MFLNQWILACGTRSTVHSPDFCRILGVAYGNSIFVGLTDGGDIEIAPLGIFADQISADERGLAVQELGRSSVGFRAERSGCTVSDSIAPAAREP